MWSVFWVFIWSMNHMICKSVKCCLLILGSVCLSVNQSIWSFIFILPMNSNHLVICIFMKESVFYPCIYLCFYIFRCDLASSIFDPAFILCPNWNWIIGNVNWWFYNILLKFYYSNIIQFILFTNILSFIHVFSSTMHLTVQFCGGLRISANSKINVKLLDMTLEGLEISTNSKITVKLTW